MTKIVIDAQTWANLRSGNELLELCNSSGETLAVYQPAVRTGVVEGGKIRSPFSDAELEQRYRQGGGRPLAEFWKEHGR